jgi:hypothetical protein
MKHRQNTSTHCGSSDDDDDDDDDDDKGSRNTLLTGEKCKIKIYKTIILPFVLYGFETWYLTLREEHRLEGV